MLIRPEIPQRWPLDPVKQRIKQMEAEEAERRLTTLIDFTSSFKQLAHPVLDEKAVCANYSELKKRNMWFWDEVGRAIGPSERAQDYRHALYDGLQAAFLFAHAATIDQQLEEETADLMREIRARFYFWATDNINTRYRTSFYGGSQYVAGYFWGTSREQSLRNLYDLCLSAGGFEAAIERTIDPWAVANVRSVGPWLKKDASVILRRDASTLSRLYLSRFSSSGDAEDIDKAVAVDPSNVEGLVERAKHFLASERIAEAEKDIKRAYAAHKKLERQGMSQVEIAESFQATFEGNYRVPENLWIAWSRVDYAKGNLSAALSRAKKVVSQNPRSTVAREAFVPLLVEHAQQLVNKKRSNQAITSLKEGIRLLDGDSKLQTLLEHIRGTMGVAFGKKPDLP